MDKFYGEESAYFTKIHDQGVADYEKISADKSMTEEQKREAARKLSEATLEDILKHRGATEAARKELREKCKDVLGEDFDLGPRRGDGPKTSTP